MEYKEYKLGELTDYIKGFAFKSKQFKESGISIIKVGNLNSGLEKSGDWVYIDESEKNKYSKYKVSENDAIISTVGSWPTNPASVVGKCCIIPKKYANSLLNQNAVIVRSNSDILEQKYLNYILKGQKFKNYIIGCAQGSASQASITLEDIKNYKINLPEIKIQKYISNFLYKIDKKIELNNQINNNFQELMNCLYEENYINKENIEHKKLVEFMPVITGKKDANIATENGEYPFFTCSQNISYTDKYSFDSDSILLAGNGDFNVKFCRGKFEAYQRTYVLTPINKENLGFLYQSIKYNLNKITSGSRGSVIKFITKGNIENCEIPYINDKELISRFQKILFTIENLDKENEKLKRLRDTLLPSLMNGEIDLDKIEI